MAVTRLERKARRNKTRAKERVKEIKRNVSRLYVKSPYKDESGVVLDQDIMEIAAEIAEQKKDEPTAKAAKAEKPEKAEKSSKEEKAPKAEMKSEKSADDAKAPKADKLNKIEGIGPKIAQVLNEAGINSFADLAASTPEKIREILDSADGNFAAHDPATWPKQSSLAAEGKWDELQKWQDELDGGKE